MARPKGSSNKVNKIAKTIANQSIEPKIERIYSEKFITIATQAKSLFQFYPVDKEEDFLLKLKYFMTKCNLFEETITTYWLGRFYQEYTYYNIDYIRKEMQGIK